jgi:hypothetical protein
MAVDASLPLGSGRAATAVTSAIRTAAQATGTSFNYLLATARIESDLNPSLTMKSSSAAGLFQFIDQTWLGTLKQAGPAFGYGDYANAITRNASGHYSVDDPDMRRQIMKLRNDPTANSVMAGVLTQKNAAALQRRIGRPPTDAELYVAHFLGAGGAGKLIQLTGSNPQASAADAFPLAAQSNRPIFYDRQGNARSMSGVYAELARRFKVASDGPGGTTAVAAASRGRPVIDVAAVTRVFAAAQPSAAASATGTARASAVPASGAPAAAQPATAQAAMPTFNSLFRDQDRRTALDPMVVALWSAPESLPQPAGTPPTQAPPADHGGGISRFDLFQDIQPSTRALFGGN